MILIIWLGIHWTSLDYVHAWVGEIHHVPVFLKKELIWTIIYYSHCLGLIQQGYKRAIGWRLHTWDMHDIYIYAYIYIILLIHINVLVCTWLFKAMCISIGISIGINQCQIPLSHLRRCEDGLLHFRRALARANASLAWRSARPIPSASHVINTGGLLIKNDQKWRGSDGFTEITEMGIITWPIYANIVLNILCMPAPMWTNPVRNNVF